MRRYKIQLLLFEKRLAEWEGEATNAAAAVVKACYELDKHFYIVHPDTKNALQATGWVDNGEEYEIKISKAY